MSVVESSTTSGSPPPESWAGKSRNAKAQARHRAKRKAYIEQLEQTVSKLQTALAFSAEDVANLPTAQMKLLELKHENDTLRAELWKLQMQATTSTASPPHSSEGRLPTRMLSPVSSEEHLRQPKRRRVSPATMHEYVMRNLRAYLEPEDVIIAAPHFNDADSPEALHVSIPPPMSQQAGIHLQRQVTAPHPSELPSSRNGMLSWGPYPEVSLVDTPPMLSSKVGFLHNNGASFGHTFKTEEIYSHNNPSETSASYSLTHAIPLGDSTLQQNVWHDGALPYSAVRM